MPGKKGASKSAKIGNKKAKKSGKATGPVGKDIKKQAPKTKKVIEQPEEDLDADIAKDEATVSRKTKANRLNEAQARADSQDDPKEPRGVVYIGHLPKGFYEPQMKTFFDQFGKVTRLRLSRSKKNAGSKGYAFVEFAEESVAAIVAETMNKYLLFDKVLVCHLVPKEKQHRSLFKGCARRFVNLSAKRLRQAVRDFNDRPTVEVNGVKVPQTTFNQVRQLKSKNAKMKAKLTMLGVNFDLEAVLSGGPDEPEEVEDDSKKEASATAGKKRKLAKAETAVVAGSSGSAAAKKKRQK